MVVVVLDTWYLSQGLRPQAEKIRREEIEAGSWKFFIRTWNALGRAEQRGWPQKCTKPFVLAMLVTMDAPLSSKTAFSPTPGPMVSISLSCQENRKQIIRYLFFAPQGHLLCQRRVLRKGQLKLKHPLELNIWAQKSQRTSLIENEGSSIIFESWQKSRMWGCFLSFVHHK